MEAADATIDTFSDSGPFAELDIELAAALVKIAHGEIGREINLEVNKAAKRGTLMKGRQILWMIYHSNRLDEEAGSLFSYEDLAAVEWLGDNKMETFLQNWDMVLEGCGEDVDPKRYAFSS